MNHALTATKHVFVSLIFVVVGVLFYAGQASAAPVSWDGGGDGTTWESANNWSGDAIPDTADDVTIDATVTLTISATDTVGSLTLGNVGGTTSPVLQFNYAPIAGSAMVVTNDLIMYSGSTIKHTQNTTTQAYDIEISVGGDMTINSGATIDLDVLGYQGPATSTTAGNGPGAGLYGDYRAGGAGHGGAGGGAYEISNGAADDFTLRGSAYGSTWDQGLGTGPVTIGSSGATAHSGANQAGVGGGAVKLDVTGTLTVDGIITTDGGSGGISGTTSGSGGGSGGSIYLTAGTFAGSGTMTADGGAGGNGSGRLGGAGGGGRIYIRYTTSALASSDFITMISANGADGATSGIYSAEDARNGSVMIVDEEAQSDLTDANVYVVDGIRFESGEENAATPTRFAFNSLYMEGESTSDVMDVMNLTTASNIDVAGTLTMSNIIWICSGVTSFTLAGGTVEINEIDATDAIDLTCAADLLFTADTTISTTIDEFDITVDTIGLTMPAASSIILTDSTWTATDGSVEGTISLDDDVDMTLGTGSGNNSSLVGNVTFDINLMNIFSGSSIVADGLGCVGSSSANSDGYGPDVNADGVCTVSTGGYGYANGWGGGGGGGYGGAGGRGYDGSLLGNVGATFGTSNGTLYMGASGATAHSGGDTAGSGGGLIEITVDETFTLNGTLSADGGAGLLSPTNNGAGGGSGGGIYVNAASIAGSTGGVSSDGGAGSDSSRDGGAGGGGRIYFEYNTNDSSWLASVSSANATIGGVAGGSAEAGADGSFDELDNPPTFVSAAAVSDTVIQITMSEAISSVTFGASTAWWSASFTSSGVAINGDTTKIDVTVPSLGSTAFTAADFAFVTANGGVIQDGGGQQAVSFSGKAIADGQAPVADPGNAVYQDRDGDGDIDAVLILFSELIVTNSVVVGDFAWTAGEFTSSDIVGGSNTGRTNEYDLVFLLGTDGPANKTSTTSTAPTLQYTKGGGRVMADAAGNSVASFNSGNGGTMTVGDGAAPAFVSAEATGDTTVVVTMTETVKPVNYVASGDWTATGFTTSNATSTGSDALITITVSALGDTAFTASDFAFSTGSGGYIRDSGDIETASFSSKTIDDGQAPTLISSSPADSDVSVLASADVVLTFSEPMDTGSITFDCCGAGTDPGSTGAWTVSNTVYTITPNSNWTNSDVVTIDITAAPDVAGNAFGGASGGAADPFSFTIVSRSGGGVPTPGTGPAATVTTSMVLTPNGGEQISGNSAFTITWLASGDNLATISIYSSTDNGQTYTLIASGEANDGSYVWTTPNMSTSQARVRVDAVTASGGTLVSDASNGSFSISSVTVVPEPETSEPELVGPVLAQMTSPEGEILDIREGSLFRGVELSGVYQVVNGTRYVFPNEETFFTHYADFSGVQQVNDDQLRAIPFGGRMIMATGSLIKVQSDNRVFVVQDDGTIRHIPDEATAIAMYGTSWASLVHDVSVVFWFDYTVGDSLPMI